MSDSPEAARALLEQLKANMGRNAAYARVSPTDYVTPLLAHEESQFRDWARKNAPNFNPDQPVQDYDMRGFWKGLMTGDPNARSGMNANDGRIHFNDHWKTPYHKSFSNESQWATPMAPAWNELDQLRMPMNGAVVFDERRVNKK